MDTPVRTRIAPSPTGFMHVGTARTIIYDYLVAKKHQGQFVLRVEDTDQSRFVEGAIDAILDGIKWLGLDHDEGPDIGGPYAPYIQTERKERHLEVAKILLEKDKAYRCFCTKERLADLKRQQEEQKLPPSYDRHCRHLSEEEVKAELDKNTPFTVRLKMPLEGDVVCEDIVRGKVRYPSKDQDDSILLKSDGLPTYHLAAVVDDHDMDISHVIRGEEWLPSYPKHILLYQHMGWVPPKFAHIPLVLNEDRTKLSKRKGDVSLGSYINQGYLPEAMVNFLVMLGWTGPDNKEIWSLEELIDAFSLEKVHKSGAILKKEKLNWLNSHYIREKDTTELTTLLLEFYEGKGELTYTEDSVTILKPFEAEVDKVTFTEMVEHAKQRMITLNDFLPNIEFYFQEELSYDPIILTNEKMKADAETAKKGITLLIETLQDVSEEQWSLDTLKELLLSTIKEAEMKNGQVLWPMRAALTGLPASPGAFEVASVLGKEESLKRLKYAQKLL